MSTLMATKLMIGKFLFDTSLGYFISFNIQQKVGIDGLENIFVNSVFGLAETRSGPVRQELI